VRATLALYIAALIAVGTVGAVAAIPSHQEITPPDCAALLDRPRHGQGAVDTLGENIASVAAKSGRSAKKLKRQLLGDPALWVDPCGSLFYTENDELPVDPPQAAATLIFPREQTFTLHSRSNASRVIYLDFNGELIAGTAWNAYFTGGQDLVASAYDLDGAPASFNDAELAVVQNVWQRVAEDFSAFDVDVTTADPGLSAIDRSSTSDNNFGTRALVTNDGTIYGACGCAGLSYVGVFANATSHQYYQPSLIFQRAAGSNVKVLAEVASHEVGHSLGLSHDGTSSTSYYSGQGAWAPIMGTAYNRPISHWSKGEYNGANNTEDDLAVIQANGAPLRTDDVASQRTAALAIQSGVTFSGRIGTAADQDWFAIQGSGQIAIDAKVAPSSASPDLDLLVEIYDGSGSLLASANPASSAVSGDVATGLSVTLQASLPGTGTYYIKLDGSGHGSPSSDGYSDYSSVGQYTLTATVSDPSTAPQITNASLPGAAYGQPYSATLGASGGVPPYTFGLASDSGPLPEGLTLQSNTGQLAGTPTGAAGTFPIKFKVIDGQNGSSTRTISMSVADAPLVITSAIPLAPASLTLPYSYQLSATGGRGGFTWSLASGTLPLGLTLSAGGLISGTPTRATSYSFVVKVTSGGGSVTKALSMTVTAPVKVTTLALTGATVGVPYSLSVAASGGTRSYIWEIAEGTLPAGLTMTGSKISGTPTARESRTLVFRVTDTAGRVALSNPLTLNVYQVSLTSNPALPDAMRGKAYSTTLTADGGETPYRWSIATGTLPSGLTLAATGVLSGTTQLVGPFSFTAKVTDASGRTDVKNMTLTVNVDPAVPYITNSKLPAGSLTRPYSVQLDAISGPGSYVWSLASGTLPAGLTLSAAGLISGTPTTATTYSFTVRVTSGSATDTRSFSVPVATAVAVSTTSLTAATVGSSYSLSLAASGGTRSYVWSIESGTLPAGLTLSGYKITGTPTSAGSQTLVFRATDTAGRVALSSPLTLNVYKVAITTDAALPAAVKGRAYSVQLVAAGGVAPYVWSRSSGSLPSGLTLNSTTGVISGTPTVTGTFSYTVKATDAGRRTAIRAFSLVVSP
jgi:hypothetical protein